MGEVDGFFKSIETANGKAFINLNGENGNKLNTIHAHLIIEEILTDALRLTFSFGTGLEDARLQFHQKLKLYRALKGDKFSSDIYGAIKLLNDIRNKYAHSLSSEGVDIMEEKFVAFVPKGMFEQKDMLAMGGRNLFLKHSHQRLYEKSLVWLINELSNIARS